MDGSPLVLLPLFIQTHDNLGQTDAQIIVAWSQLPASPSRALPAAASGSAASATLAHVMAALLDGGGGQTSECHKHSHAKGEGVGQPRWRLWPSAAVASLRVAMTGPVRPSSRGGSSCVSEIKGGAQVV